MTENYKKSITGFYRKNRRMPSYAEMMTLLGFKSKNAVFKLIKKLEKLLVKDVEINLYELSI